MSMSWVTDYEALLSLQGVTEICQLTLYIIQLLLVLFQVYNTQFVLSR